MKATEMMQQQTKWFLKTYLQHQSLLQFSHPDPTQHELYQFIQTFSSRNRNLSINSAISKLYAIMRQATDSLIVPPLIYDDIINIRAKIQDRIFQNSNVRQYQYGSTQSDAKVKFQNEQQTLHKKFLVQNKGPPEFLSQANQHNYETRRYIIEAYVQKQYGMTHLREFLMQHNLKVQLDYRYYASIVNSLVTEGFRATQRFLQENCGILVTAIKKDQLRKLYPILLKLRQWVAAQSFKIYVLFLRCLYNLGPRSTKVSALAVYNLYQQIMRLLSIRLVEVQNASVRVQKSNDAAGQSKNAKIFYIQGQYQSNKISTIKNWNKQNEEQLVNFYLEDQDMSRIRQKYRQKYGQTTIFEKMNTLRSHLYQVIRKTLRRIQLICSLEPEQYSQEMRESISLKNQERYVQLVNTSPQFVKARIALCKYYKTRSNSLIYQIAQELSIALKQKSKKSDAMTHVSN